MKAIRNIRVSLEFEGADDTHVWKLLPWPAVRILKFFLYKETNNFTTVERLSLEAELMGSTQCCLTVVTND